MNRKIINSALLGIFITSLTACGGGGGSSSEAPIPEPSTQTGAAPSTTNQVNDTSADTETVNFQADKGRLSESATDSTQLYVESSFSFDMSQLVNFYLTVNGSDGNPSGNTFIRFYDIPIETISWDMLSAEETGLLFVARTDANGLFERQFEISPSTKKILVVVSTIGIDNKVIFTVTQDLMTHNF